MSSRVQKGGTVFKPVAKPRPRATATPAPSGSMPPPARTPSVTPSAAGSRQPSVPGSRQPSVAPARVQPGSTRAAVPIVPTRSAPAVSATPPSPTLEEPAPPQAAAVQDDVPQLPAAGPGPSTGDPTATPAQTPAAAPPAQPITQWQQWFPQPDEPDSAAHVSFPLSRPLLDPAPEDPVPPQRMLTSDTSIGPAPNFPHLAFPPAAGPEPHVEVMPSDPEEAAPPRARRVKKPRLGTFTLGPNDAPLSDAEDAPVPRPARRRTRQPRPTLAGLPDADGAPVKKPKGKGKKKAVESALESGAETAAPAGVDNGGPDDTAEPDAPPAKKARRPRKSKQPAAESGADTDAPPAKKARRKGKGKQKADDSAFEFGADTDTDAGPAKKARRPRKRKAAESGAESSTQPPKQRRKATRKRTRAPSPPPFDVDADPGEEPDPTAVAMADLVTDSGRGRVSARAAEVVGNHAAWKAAAKVRRAALKARVEARKYGREDDEDAAPGKDEGVAAAKEGTAAPLAEEDVQPNPDAAPDAGEGEAGAGAEDETDEHGFNYSQHVDTSKFTVQVRIGPNGETIVDEQSLFVDRAGGEDDTAGYTHIEESDLTKFVNSMTHSKKAGGSRWSAEETELFFDALRQFGENYELLALVLPGRDRKACRNKFKAEDKRSTNRINWCLNNRLSYDISTLSRLTGKDFSGPTPIIRGPTPLEFPEGPTPTKDSAPALAAKTPAKAKRKKNKTQALAPDEEIVGAADTFVDEDDA